MLVLLRQKNLLKHLRITFRFQKGVERANRKQFCGNKTVTDKHKQSVVITIIKLGLLTLDCFVNFDMFHLYKKV